MMKNLIVAALTIVDAIDWQFWTKNCWQVCQFVAEKISA
jgi:hypothetical protein